MHLIAASLVLARAFGRDDRWRPLRTYCVVTGVLGFALLVLYVIEPAPAWNGLVQRIFVSVLFVWIAVVGFWLSRVNLSLAQRRAARAPSAVIHRSLATATHEMPRSRKRSASSGVPAKPPTVRPYAVAACTIRDRGLASESSSSRAGTVVPKVSERSYGPTNS